MNELIIRHKEFIKSKVKGIDTSLKLKGLSLYRILQDVDIDTSLTEDELHHKFNIYYNRAMLELRRKNKQPSIQWLEGNSSVILKYLYTYSYLSRNVYKVDENLINWYRGINISERDSLRLLDENDLGGFIFAYNNELYSVEVLSGSESIGRHVSIVNLSIDSPIVYSLDYEVCPDKDDRVISMSVICSNKSCPRWKQSLGKEYAGGFKDCYCSLDDWGRCNCFNESGVINPLDSLLVVKAIYFCMLNRGYKSSASENRNVLYEHIPLPQRDDDVIIYFGESDKNKSLESIGLVPVSKMESNSIVSSHASPREHHRRGGTRKAYVRKDGVKVRETTFRETVVNKGNTKTSYKFKERAR